MEKKSKLELLELKFYFPLIIIIIQFFEKLKLFFFLSKVMPTDHGHEVCKYHQATPELVDKAIAGALKAKTQWEG